MYFTKYKCVCKLMFCYFRNKLRSYPYCFEIYSQVFFIEKIGETYKSQNVLVNFNGM